MNSTFIPSTELKDIPTLNAIVEAAKQDKK